MEKPKRVTSGILLLGALIVATVALLVFGWLAEEMMEGETQLFDEFVRDAVHEHASPGLTKLMQGFSFLGSPGTVIILGIVFLGAFIYFHRTRLAALLGITILGMGALDAALKLAFHRVRPVAFFGVTPSSYSFPSGHAMGSFCFYGVLAALSAARALGKGAKWGIWTAAALLVGMIGLSRIYLGVHYPSDVIAGYCAGAMWVGAVGLVDKFLMARRTSRK